MKIKTSKLTDAALDWAVAKCVNPAHWVVGTHQDNKGQWRVTLHGERSNYTPSTDWSQGGPIIEREAHNLFKHNGGTEWCCACNVSRDEYTAIVTADGPTPLIAAMRSFVVSRLGEEVEVPDELT